MASAFSIQARVSAFSGVGFPRGLLGRPCAGLLKRFPRDEQFLGPGVPMPLRRLMRDFAGLALGLAFGQSSGASLRPLCLALQEALDRSFSNCFVPRHISLQCKERVKL